MKASDISVKRESVDIDPLAILLAASKIESPPLGLSGVPGNSDENRLAASSPKTVVFDTNYFTEKFMNECRTVPLDFRTVPNNIVGMQACANARAWKNALQISSSIMVLNGKAGLEYVVLPAAPESSNSVKKLVLSPVLRLRLEGLFRLKLFDEVIEEINNALTNVPNLTPVAAEESVSEMLHMNITNEKKYAAVVPHLDFDTLMVLNMLILEVRLVTGRNDEAMEELCQLKNQLYYDIHKLDANLSSTKVWKYYYWYWVVIITLCNASCRHRQWRVAITEMTHMLHELSSLRSVLITNSGVAKDAAGQAKCKQLHLNLCNAEILIRCRLCRMMLQIGAVSSCRLCLAECIQLIQCTSTPFADTSVPPVTNPSARLSLDEQSALINNYSVDPIIQRISGNLQRNNEDSAAMQAYLVVGLLFYCQNEFERALACFETIMKREQMLQEVSLDTVGDHRSGTPGTSGQSSSDIFQQLSHVRSAYEPVPVLTSGLRSSPGMEAYIPQIGMMECACVAIYNQLGDNSITSDIEAANSTNESLLTASINNYAICCLHLKHIQQAVVQFERLIKLAPTVYLIDPIIFNLCTMYDLTCSSDVSLCKKKALQAIATAYYIEDPLLHWKCFRLASAMS